MRLSANSWVVGTIIVAVLEAFHVSPPNKNNLGRWPDLRS